MTPETRQLVLEALDEALKGCVIQGFQGFLMRPNEEAQQAFVKGLNIAVGLHEQFVGMLQPDKEIEDVIQRRDGADRPEDVPAEDEAKAFLSRGW